MLHRNGRAVYRHAPRRIVQQTQLQASPVCGGDSHHAMLGGPLSTTIFAFWCASLVSRRISQHRTRLFLRQIGVIISDGIVFIGAFESCAVLIAACSVGMSSVSHHAFFTR